MYIQDGTSTAVQLTGNSGFYIPDGGIGTVKWNTGSNIGTYQIPFISTTGYSVPVSITILTAPTSGSLNISNIDIPSYFPSYKNPYSINRYWTYDLSAYSTLPTGSITSTFLSTDVPSGYTTLVSSYYNTTVNAWRANAAAVINLITHVVTFPISSNVQTDNAYHSWTLVKSGTPLPIKLISLTSTPVDNSYLKLNWSTASEIDNRGFIIERSLNGITFDSIGWENGQINSNETFNYYFNDRNVSNNTSYYYRLNQIDEDGKSSLTYIVSSIILDPKSTAGYVSNPIPNPAENYAKINTSNLSQLVQIDITDLGGRIVKSSIVSSSEYINLDLNGLASSTYVVSIKSGSETFYRKLIIKNN